MIALAVILGIAGLGCAAAGTAYFEALEDRAGMYGLAFIFLGGTFMATGVFALGAFMLIIGVVADTLILAYCIRDAAHRRKLE